MHKPKPLLPSKVSIYLAGSIKKAHEPSNELFWAEEEIKCIQTAFQDWEVALLNPAFRTDDLSDQRSVFGRDMLSVYCADAIFVDARQRRGLGVGAEMMWAKFNNLPVITYAPKGTHYHLAKTTLLGVEVENWVHPFVESLSDAIVETIPDAVQWLKSHLSGEPQQVKGVDYIRQAMAHYCDTQYEHDAPMQELMNESMGLKSRLVRATAGVV